MDWVCEDFIQKKMNAELQKQASQSQELSAEHSKAEHSKAEHSKAEHSKAEHSKEMQRDMVPSELKPQRELGGSVPDELTSEQILKVAEAAYAHMQQSRFDDAEKMTSVLAKLIPDCWYFHSLMGVIHLEAFLAGYKTEKYNLDAAESALNRALQLNPDDIATYVNRSEVLLYRGDLPGSIDNLKQVKALDPECKNPYTARAQQFAAGLVQALERLKAQQEAAEAAPAA